MVEGDLSSTRASALFRAYTPSWPSEHLQPCAMLVLVLIPPVPSGLCAISGIRSGVCTRSLLLAHLQTQGIPAMLCISHLTKGLLLAVWAHHIVLLPGIFCRPLHVLEQGWA